MPFTGDFTTEAVRGKFSNYRFTAIESILSNFVAGAETDIWGGGQFGVTNLVYPTTPGTVTINSTNLADNPTGTGARIVWITGLGPPTAGSFGTHFWTEKSEYVTLNGTANVVTTGLYYRVNRMHVVSVGSSGQNVGGIQALIGGNLQKTILAGQGTSHDSHLSLPWNMVGLLMRVDGPSSTVDFGVRLKTRQVLVLPPNNVSAAGSWLTPRRYHSAANAELSERQYLGMTVIPPRSDIRATLTTSGALGGIRPVHFGYTLQLIQQEEFDNRMSGLYAERRWERVPDPSTNKFFHRFGEPQ